MGPKWEDTEEVSTSSAAPTWDDTEEIEAAPDYSKQEVSQPEAFGVGAIQGSTLGTAPIASGVGGFLSNAVEQIGDTLGLTTDSQLEDQGFTFPDKKTGLEGMMSEYYDSRERMKGLQDASADQHPWTTLAGNVAGSIPTTIAAGGLTSGAKLGQGTDIISKTAGLAQKAMPNFASKILPQADKFTKATGVGAKMLAGAREGAKAGALTGFGSGDAKLAEGELYDTFRDTADSAVGGAVMGGIVPAVVPTIKALGRGAKSIVPGLESFEVGRTLGKIGKDVTEESVDDLSREYSENLLKNVQSIITKASKDKRAAFEIADEVGIRVNAGQRLDEAIDEIMAAGATPGGIDKKEKDIMVNAIKSLQESPVDKLAQKSDLARAKMQQKMEQKGYELLDEQSVDNIVQDFVPNSDATKKLALTQQNYQKILEEGAEGTGEAATKEISKPVSKLVQQVDNVDTGVPEVRLNANSAKLNELERMIGELNRYTGFGDSNPIKGQKNIAKMKELVGDLRAISNEAIDGSLGEADVNRKMSTSFAALKKAGIDVDEIFTDNRFNKDDLSRMLEDITTSDGRRKDARQFFRYMKEIDDPSFTELQEKGNFIRKANEVAAQAEGTTKSTGLASLFGTISGRVAKTGNVVGAAQTKIKDTSEILMKKAGKALFNSTPESLQNLATKVGASTNRAYQQYVGPLQKAAQASDRQRSAILYGLYQQPAFRDMYQDLGQDINDIALPEEDNN